MIAVYCDRCGEELTEPGALEISPPTANGVCVKTHVCVKCWKEPKYSNNIRVIAVMKQRDELAALLREARRRGIEGSLYNPDMRADIDAALARIKP